jgi:hypothetical protein
VLRLANNSLTGNIPITASTARNLLNLKKANSTPALLLHVQIRLQVLRLANNSLTGNIPTTATTARNLFMLDLHSNKLSGNLPDNWATPALQMLMLEDNHFTGD